MILMSGDDTGERNWKRQGLQHQFPLKIKDCICLFKKLEKVLSFTKGAAEIVLHFLITVIFHKEMSSHYQLLTFGVETFSLPLSPSESPKN